MAQLAGGIPPDSPLAACFQLYIDGEITLGQAIGRTLDRLAQEKHPRRGQ